MGTGLFGPINVAWYKWLDVFLSGQTRSIVLKKTILDQFVLGPPALALFFVSMSFMEGKRDLTEELRKKYLASYACDCIFWLPVQAVNFMFVPAAYRVIYLSAAGFVWLNILCIIKNFESYYKVVKQNMRNKRE